MMMTSKEETKRMGLDLYDLAEEWTDSKAENLYRCSKHKRAKAPRFGCVGCVRERDAAERLREEAREVLPDNFLALITG
jgi:hypothetical protein